MKKTIFTLLTIISGFQLFSQAIEMKKSYITLGYGLVGIEQSFLKSSLYPYYSPSGLQYKLIGPIYLKYEYALNDVIGIGFSIAQVNGSVSQDYEGFDEDNGNYRIYTQKIKYSSFSALARINFHLGYNPKFDPYFGTGIGYRTLKAEQTSNEPNYQFTQKISGFPVGLEAVFGCRFYFSEHIGAYTEIGLAKSVFQFGLVAKL